MKQNDETRDNLLRIAEPVCQDLGYELVDITYKPEQGGWIVRAYIDRLSDGDSAASAIGFQDCERVSRELSTVFDVEDPVPHAYSLEVSSPGADRPLRGLDQFRRFVGQSVAITLHDSVETAGNRRNYKGVLFTPEDCTEGSIGVEVDGGRYQLHEADIKTAKLVPDWEQLFKDAKQQAG